MYPATNLSVRNQAALLDVSSIVITYNKHTRLYVALPALGPNDSPA